MTTKKQKGGAPQEEELFILTLFNIIICHWWTLAIVFISIIGGVIYIIYKLNPFNIGKNYYYTSGMVITIFGLFLASIYAYTYYQILNFKGEKKSCNFDNLFKNNYFINYILKFFLLIGIICLIMGLIYLIYWLYVHVHNISVLTTNLFIIFSIIIGLAIVYSIFEIFIIGTNPKEHDKKNLKDLIIKFIFYIPCLLIDVIKYIEHQFSITTKPIWILLMLELIIIILYFIIPIIFTALILHDGKEILKGPIYTNNLKNLGNYQNLTITKKINYNYNYGLSFFLYINPQPTSTSAAYSKYTSLFNYANKPNILYNAKKNILKIVFQNKKNDLVNIYEMKNISYQKWMHFVINYNSGNVDIFIDNNLVVSHSNIAPYMTSDKITVGATNGINGGIKNIIYFNEIIPKNKLILLFNSNKN